MSAEELGLKTTGTEVVMEFWLQDALKQVYTHGDDPEIDARVESAYEKLTDMKFDARLAQRPNPYFLHGFPGHGKTTVFTKGAERLADILGMNFVANPPNDYKPSKNDLVYLVQELSGEVSNTEVGGIPNKGTFQTEDGNKYEAMVKIPKPQIMAAREAGAAVICYDDVASAGASVVNSVLGVAQFGMYQGISFGKRTTIGFTGNLGAIDGTNISRPSKALDSRCQHFYVEDNVKNWIAREESKPIHCDEYGTGYLTEFLEAHPDLFHLPPKTAKEKSMSLPYPTPRTWSAMVPQARQVVAFARAMEQGGARGEFMQKVGNQWSQLEARLRGHVGPNVVSKAIGWYQSKLSSAEPLARLLIEKGELPEKSIKILKDKAGDGVQSDKMTFQNQFVNSMVDHATRLIAEAPTDMKLRERVLKAFYGGIWDHFPSTDSTKALAFNKLSTKLKNNVEELRNGDNISHTFTSSMIEILGDYSMDRKQKGQTNLPSKDLVVNSLIPAMTGSMNSADNTKLLGVNLADLK